MYSEIWRGITPTDNQGGSRMGGASKLHHNLLNQKQHTGHLGTHAHQVLRTNRISRHGQIVTTLKHKTHQLTHLRREPRAQSRSPRAQVRFEKRRHTCQENLFLLYNISEVFPYFEFARLGVSIRRGRIEERGFLARQMWLHKPIKLAKPRPRRLHFKLLRVTIDNCMRTSRLTPSRL